MPDIVPTAGGGTIRGGRPSALVPRGSAVQQAGDAVAQLGVELAAEANRQQAAARSLRIAQSQATFNQRALLDVDALNPLAADYEAQLRDTLRTARDGAVEAAEVQDPQTLGQLTAELEIAGTEIATRALLQRRDVLEGEGVRIWSEQREATMARIEEDPEGADLYLDQLRTEGGAALAAVSPERLPVLEQELEISAIESAARGLANRGDFAAARALVDDARSTLGAQGHRTMRTILTEQENRQRNERLVSTQRAVADLDLAISRSTTLDDLSAAQEAFDLADAEGVFVGRARQRTTVQQDIDRRRARIIEAHNEADGIINRFETGLGLNTPQEADAAWEHYLQTRVPLEAQQDLDALGGYLADFASAAGIVPSAARDLIERAGRSASPAALGSAALLDARVRAQNPLVETGANAAVDAARALILHGGLDPQRAGELALERVNNPEVVQQRRTLLEEGVREEYLAPDAVQDGLEDALGQPGFFGRTLGAVGLTDPTGARVVDPAQSAVAARMVGEYERSFEEMFLLTGDAEVAAGHAADNVAVRYGPSRTGAQPTEATERGESFVPFPPERILQRMSAGPGQHLALTLEQSGEVLVDRLNRSLRSRFPGIDPMRVSLRPTGQTEFELAAGRPASYGVYIDDGTGLPPRPLLDDGRPVLFRLPTLGQLVNDPAYKAVEGRAAQEFREDRERRRLPLEQDFGVPNPPPVTFAPSTPENIDAGREAAAQTLLGD